MLAGVAKSKDAGFARDLLEESLGHQIGTAVERALSAHDSFDRRQAIMQAWADFCGGEPVGRRGFPLGIKAPAMMNPHDLRTL